MLLRPLLRSATTAFAPSLSSSSIRAGTSALRVATAASSAYVSTVADVILTLNLPPKFGHFIGGEFVEPVEGEYFDNPSPINGEVFIQAARGTKVSTYAN